MKTLHVLIPGLVSALCNARWVSICVPEGYSLTELASIGQPGVQIAGWLIIVIVCILFTWQALHQAKKILGV